MNRAGEALCFAGVLSRDAVPALWKQLPSSLDGVRALDLTAVRSVDSAGLAFLAEIAAQRDDMRIIGSPAGLAELQSAYRLDATLGFGLSESGAA